MPDAFLTPGDGTRCHQVLDIFGDQVRIKVRSADTSGSFALITSHTPPNGGPPLHTHISDDEAFYVLSGTFVFELDDQQVHAVAGDTVFIPAGVKHLYQNTGTETGELLLVVMPGGLDDFFVELDALLRLPGAPDMGAIAQLHATYKMELLGPPLAARGA